MTARMSAIDAAFVHRETRTSPQHLGGIIMLASHDPGLDYRRLLQLLEERISLAPRYRQRIRLVPGRLASPVWIDDPRFDITYHVRRSALPRPGTDAQLLEFAARVLSRRLDRHRPLWEMYLVEGLSEGRSAIITKTHAAVVGEPDGIDLAEVILDASPRPRGTLVAPWRAAPPPSGSRVFADAVADLARCPAELAGRLGSAARTVMTLPARGAVAAWAGPAGVPVAGVPVAGVAGLAGLAGLAARTMTAAEAGLAAVRALGRREPPSPLHAELGEQRRLAIARTRLADFVAVRDAFGGTVNDVVLCVVAGALRGWLSARDVRAHAAFTVRALVPMSTDVAGDAPVAGAGRTVRPVLVDLPVGEADAVRRLALVRVATAGAESSGGLLGARAITELAGFAPPTLHALGARAAAGLSRRIVSVVITNVPGPQRPLYATGVRMSEMFPFTPLQPGQALSIACTSYDGGLYFGINGDRDAVPDIADFDALIRESLAQLLAAVETRTEVRSSGGVGRGGARVRAGRSTGARSTRHSDRSESET